MANFSTSTAEYAANFIKSEVLNYTPSTLQNAPMKVALALFTSGVNVTNLAKGIINNEVLANVQTKYIRKDVTDTWSQIFGDSDTENPLLEGVELPTNKNGFATMFNETEIIWNNPPLAPWGTVTHYAIIATQMISLAGHVNQNIATPHAYVNPHPIDGARNEYVLMWGQFTTPKNINIGDIFRFPFAALQVDIF